MEQHYEHVTFWQFLEKIIPDESEPLQNHQH